ncbi:hypothetical protein ACRAWB_13655 [Leifsonia poae]|uniref:hypothetical protein n=1 Tax=Leifsonia poae TaxID=110933 RepID=UPI003D69F8F8
MSGVVTSNAPSTYTVGNYVFVSAQKTNGARWNVFCYTTSGTPCTGSWPQTNAGTNTQGGAVFAPILSTTGTPTGICTIANGPGTSSDCWTFTGAVAPVNPYAGTGANYWATGGNVSGDVFVTGTKVYVSTGDAITCRDFSRWSGTGAVPACTGFTNPTNGKNYTVRSAASIAPNCLVADGDAASITLFNGLTGGACTTAASPGIFAVSPVDGYCGSGAAGLRGWDTVSLAGLTSSAYTDATVTVQDQNGTVVRTGTLRPGQSLDLSTLSSSVTSVSVTVVLNGVNDPNGVANGQVVVTWKGDPLQMCFQTVVPPQACDAAPRRSRTPRMP